MDTRPPLWRQPWTLLMIALILSGIVLIVSGRLIAGAGAISAGTIINSVLLLRMQIRAADERTRARRPRQ